MKLQEIWAPALPEGEPQEGIEASSFEVLKTKTEIAVLAIRKNCSEYFPEVLPLESFWPAPQAPDYLWRAAYRWQRIAWKLLRKEIERPEFLEATAEMFPPPWDTAFRAWFHDALHEKMVIDNFDTLLLIRLHAALRADDTNAISRELTYVLDRAGERVRKWARIEAAWMGMRGVQEAARSGNPMKNAIRYLRRYVSEDAEERAQRYGDERAADAVRIADGERKGEKLERVSADLLEDLFDERLDLGREALEEYQAGLNRIAEVLRPEDRTLLEVMGSGNLSAAEAERSLGTPGAWRNMVKRLRRALQDS